MEFKWNNFNLTSYEEDVKPFVEELLAREVNSDAGFRKWLTDSNYLGKWLSESFIRVSIQKDRYSTPENFERYENVYKLALLPFLSAENKLEKRVAQLAVDYNPRIPGFEGYLKRQKNSLEIYREENVVVQKSVADAATRYSKLQNSLFIELDGERIPHSAANDLLRGTDRHKRKTVFGKLAEAEATIATDVDQSLTEIIALRQQMAKNAGYDNTLEYLAKKIGRLDYDIAAVKQLHATVKKLFVPLMGKLSLLKKSMFGYEHLYKWDLNSDYYSFPDSSLFTDTEEFFKKIAPVLDKIHPVIAGYFFDIYNAGNFDLEPRVHKRSGAYQAFLPSTGIPFIFGNINRNIIQFRIFFHEMGHALHTFLCQPNFFREVTSYPTEVAELASQSLELISTMYYAELITHNAEDENKFRLEAMRAAIMSIVWPTMQDEFSHWLYENPAHTVEARMQKWDALYAEYFLHIENGDEETKRYLYRNIGHFYFADRPLYHIEYAISMIGAAHIYFQARENLPATMEKYLAALRLGYSASIPEIYKTAGIDFDFSEIALTGLAQLIDKELSGFFPSAKVVSAN